MRILLLITTIIQYGHAYSMYDLNNNARTWEFSGCHASIIPAERSEKYIVSSSYPNIYSQYMNCEWRVQAPIGKKVKITFPEFNIDNCGQAGIKMYDGRADSASFKAEYCGSNPPADFISSGNLVTMNVYQRQTSLGRGIAIMVGYSYVENQNNQPNNKYQIGQSSGTHHNGNNQSQDQLYDLLMSKLLDGAMPQPKPQNPYADYGMPALSSTSQRSSNHQPKEITGNNRPQDQKRSSHKKRSQPKSQRSLSLILTSITMGKFVIHTTSSWPKSKQKKRRKPQR